MKNTFLRLVLPTLCVLVTCSAFAQEAAPEVAACQSATIAPSGTMDANTYIDCLNSGANAAKIQACSKANPIVDGSNEYAQPFLSCLKN